MQITSNSYVRRLPLWIIAIVYLKGNGPLQSLIYSRCSINSSYNLSYSVLLALLGGRYCCLGLTEPVATGDKAQIHESQDDSLTI